MVERKTGGFTTGYKITHKADGKRDKRDRRQEKKNQQNGVAPGVGLALKETGVSHASGPQKATFGAWRASGDSSSSCDVSLKANMPATKLLGNCSRKML